MASASATLPTSATALCISSISSCALPTVAPRELPRTHREPRTTPRAVAPRRAEARDLALEHHHPQRRFVTEQVIGRPEPRETGAEDRHVGFHRALQRRPRDELFARRLQPEAVTSVVPGASAL